MTPEELTQCEPMVGPYWLYMNNGNVLPSRQDISQCGYLFYNPARGFYFERWTHAIPMPTNEDITAMQLVNVLQFKKQMRRSNIESRREYRIIFRLIRYLKPELSAQEARQVLRNIIDADLNSS